MAESGEQGKDIVPITIDELIEKFELRKRKLYIKNFQSRFTTIDLFLIPINILFAIIFGLTAIVHNMGGYTGWDDYLWLLYILFLIDFSYVIFLRKYFIRRLAKAIKLKINMDPSKAMPIKVIDGVIHNENYYIIIVSIIILNLIVYIRAVYYTLDNIQMLLIIFLFEFIFIAMILLVPFKITLKNNEFQIHRILNLRKSKPSPEMKKQYPFILRRIETPNKINLDDIVVYSYENREMASFLAALYLLDSKGNLLNIQSLNPGSVVSIANMIEKKMYYRSVNQIPNLGFTD